MRSPLLPRQECILVEAVEPGFVPVEGPAGAPARVTAAATGPFLDETIALQAHHGSVTQRPLRSRRAPLSSVCHTQFSRIPPCGLNLFHSRSTNQGGTGGLLKANPPPWGI